jgi:hypothetical protein
VTFDAAHSADGAERVSLPRARSSSETAEEHPPIRLSRSRIAHSSPDSDPQAKRTEFAVATGVSKGSRTR